MTAHTHDDAFHEIQLNGKQLVFLVMAATVVSVAIFLCGVLVGRNVRAERAAMLQAAVAAQSPTADVLPQLTAIPAVPIQTDVDPRTAAPPPTLDDGTAKPADDPQTVADVLKPAAPRPEVPATPAKAVASTKTATDRTADQPQPKVAVPPVPAKTGAPALTAAPVAAAPPADAPPVGGSGYAVQVAALNVRGEADAIAKRLSAKGYTAYVQVPTSGTPSVYRVRIGTFQTRREAETVATRLQKEEQFKPWVTR